MQGPLPGGPIHPSARHPPADHFGDQHRFSQPCAAVTPRPRHAHPSEGSVCHWRRGRGMAGALRAAGCLQEVQPGVAQQAAGNRRTPCPRSRLWVQLRRRQGWTGGTWQGHGGDMGGWRGKTTRLAWARGCEAASKLLSASNSPQIFLLERSWWSLAGGAWHWLRVAGSSPGCGILGGHGEASQGRSLLWDQTAQTAPVRGFYQQSGGGIPSIWREPGATPAPP